MTVTRWIVIAITALMIVSCRLKIIVPEGGNVTTASGAYNCNAGKTCKIDVVDLFFDETFIAEPSKGYKFKSWKKWRKKRRGFCGGSSKPCRLHTPPFEGFPELMSFLESDEVFYLKPVFERPDTWAARADMPTPRIGHASCTVNSKIYVFGGRPGLRVDSALNSVEEYDPETNTWAPMSTPSYAGRMACRTVWTGTEMFAHGGTPGAWTGALYNPATDSWRYSTSSSASGGGVDGTLVWTGKFAVGIFGGQYLVTAGTQKKLHHLKGCHFVINDQNLFHFSLFLQIITLSFC